MNYETSFRLKTVIRVKIFSTFISFTQNYLFLNGFGNEVWKLPEISVKFKRSVNSRCLSKNPKAGAEKRCTLAIIRNYTIQILTCDCLKYHPKNKLKQFCFYDFGRVKNFIRLSRCVLYDGSSCLPNNQHRHYLVLIPSLDK